MRTLRARHTPLPDDGTEVVLVREASRHLAQVLRVRAGDTVVLFDGLGHEVVAEVVHADRSGTRVVARGPTVRRAPRHRLHLLIGLPKGPAMDLALRAGTECGLTDVHPVLSERAVPKGDRPDRWTRIVESAAQQCGRADVPTLHPARPLAEALAAVAHVPTRWVAVPGAPRPTAPSAGEAAVLIGPEGGLTEAEVAAAQHAGFAALGLGRWVLRASTAVPVAVAMVAPPA